MKVSKVRQRLQAIVAQAALDPSEEHGVNQILAALAKYDAMEVEAAIKMFRLLPLKRPAPKAPKVIETTDAGELKRVLLDDGAFERELDRVAANKKLTKAALLGVYKDLFGSLSGVPTKSTREDLLDLIRRERIILARNAKTRMPGRRV